MRLGNRRKNIKSVTYFECENYLGPTVSAKTAGPDESLRYVPDELLKLKQKYANCLQLWCLRLLLELAIILLFINIGFESFAATLQS